MTWAGVAIGGGIAVGAGISYLGAQKSAGAAQASAEAQAAQAAANRSQTMKLLGTSSQSATDLAEASPQELAMLGEQYGVASKNLQRQQELMDSINPALMEASKQALSILRGGPASSTDGIMGVRNQQRQQLINSLKSQYGPGAESSSIGMQALMQFDQQSESMKQGAMSNLFNLAESGAPQANLMNGLNGLQSVASGYSAIQNRQLNTQLTGIGDIAGVQNQMLQTAGAPFVGAALQGQGLGSLGNNIGNSATQLGMASLQPRPNPNGNGYDSSYTNPINSNNLNASSNFQMPTAGSQNTWEHL